MDCYDHAVHLLGYFIPVVCNSTFLTNGMPGDAVWWSIAMRTARSSPCSLEEIPTGNSAGMDQILQAVGHK
jgi:hypothetical protein